MRSLSSSALVLTTLLAAGVIGCVDDTGTSVEANLTEKPKRFAPDQLAAADDFLVWSEYCVGDREATKRPLPNYDNPYVLEAAKQLSRVSSHSFALYGDFNSHHRTPVPEELEGTVKKMAHEFLGYLCGEFRDRGTMVEAKVKWVANMNYLDDEETAAYDPAGDPWAQMKQRDYHPYIRLSASLWDAKRARLADEERRYTMVGSIQTDTAVPAQTICETKYMFAEYVKKDRVFDDLATYDAGYETFRQESCNLPDEEDYYYDFRGDSNIKPNSPESNGMIWLGRSIARQCDSRKSAAPYQTARGESAVSDEVCQRYFKYPFTERWNAARAGLATWVLTDPDASGLDSNSQFTVYPRSAEDPDYVFGDVGPYIAKNRDGEAVKLLEGYRWRWGALGLPELHENNKEKLNKILQLAVDRHTDWYNSGYDDMMAYKPFKSTQAYSPFVASSYEMSKSDHFVTPGLTVPVIDPNSKNYKHWMFVFKVHKDNWYTPERINGEDTPIPNFDRYWFDETAFGDSSLANSERAWDRLGTALEDEHAALLYLHNIPAH